MTNPISQQDKTLTSATGGATGQQACLVGLFGKLPGHGDFVHRNIPSPVMSAWDAWLQAFVGSTQERLGEAWLDVYLTSPIWRFCFSEGVLDENRWAGILLPSVDRVGRYFPFTMLVKMPSGTALCQFIALQEAWFTHLEDMALQALENHLTVDELLQSVDNMPAWKIMTHQQQAGINLGAGLVVCAEQDGSAPRGAMPVMLESLISTTFASYSVWSTQGSERVAPGMITCHGLPAVSGSVAMLDGDWQNWQWSEPFAWVADQ